MGLTKRLQQSFVIVALAVAGVVATIIVSRGDTVMNVLSCDLATPFCYIQNSIVLVSLITGGVMLLFFAISIVVDGTGLIYTRLGSKRTSGVYLANLNDKLNNPFEFILHDPDYFQEGRVWVWIEIYNKSDYDIGDCFLRVKRGENQNLERLSWSDKNIRSGMGYEAVTIAGKDKWRCDIAVSGIGESNAVLCAFTQPDSDRQIFPGAYELTIFANGRSKDKPVEHSERFVLVYRGDDKLKLKKR